MAMGYRVTLEPAADPNPHRHNTTRLRKLNRPGSSLRRIRAGPPFTRPRSTTIVNQVHRRSQLRGKTRTATPKQPLGWSTI